MIQLRIRTEYTFGQTFAKIDDIVAKLKAQGTTHAGIVDIDSTWGHVPWFKACRAAGIEPLLGVDISVGDDDESASRMWFLARSTSGLSELYRLLSKAHEQPLQKRRGPVPRLYLHDVRNMSDQIMKFAGTMLDGEFLSDIDAIVDFSPGSRILTAAKRRLVDEFGFARVDVGDNRYVNDTDDDRVAFEFAVNGGRRPTAQHIIDIPCDHFENEAAELCGGVELPVAPMIHMDGDLEALARAGIEERELEWNDEYEARLVRELELIRLKNFESYFLVVADMCKFAKQHMLVGPSRGSAAGSLVCYLTHITEIDPIPPGLFFERFIDINRTDLPDIDLDFPDSKRAMVYDYMADKYGINNVAHIGTVSRFKPKSALIKACKKLGISPLATAAVKVAMIERGLADSRTNNCLEDTFNTTDPGKNFIEQYPEARICQTLEGHVSHSGVHAAGVLVCNDEITNYCVVDANGIAHLDKHAIDDLGLLKIDMLGLRTLSVIEDAGVPVDWYKLPRDDRAALDVFNDQRLCGIFQFEGNALRSLARQVKFDSLVEVDAVTALARPGPFDSGVTKEYILRHNGKQWTRLHDLSYNIMKETHGLPLYQEQTLAIVRDIGKFSWEETSFVRKAISKRQGKEFFQRFYPQFAKGAKEQGMSDEVAGKIWHSINAMGAWQMNKAHTYSYAVISYWTAYLKAHYPLEFAAATLRNAKDQDSALMLLREIVKEGVEFVAFDPDLSEQTWSIKEGKLIGGFENLVGVGAKKAEKLIAKRESEGLSEKEREDLLGKDNPFGNIFPFHSAYQRIYDDPRSAGIAGKVEDIINIQAGIPHGEERVFIGELVHKNARDANEEVNIKKRGGKKVTGPTAFVDVRLRDDTDVIGGRIGRFDFKRWGKKMLEEVPLGAHILVRAKFWNGYRYAFITKWKRLDDE